jgi:hypothetical protein
VANCVSARQGRFTGAIIKGRKYMSIAWQSKTVCFLTYIKLCNPKIYWWCFPKWRDSIPYSCNSRPNLLAQIRPGLTEEEKPTRCYLACYCTYDRLSMFRAPPCPSSGAHDYTTDYHMGRLILSLLMVCGSAFRPDT